MIMLYFHQDYGLHLTLTRVVFEFWIKPCVSLLPKDLTLTRVVFELIILDFIDDGRYI